MLMPIELFFILYGFSFRQARSSDFAPANEYCKPQNALHVQLGDKNIRGVIYYNTLGKYFDDWWDMKEITTCVAHKNISRCTSTNWF